MAENDIEFIEESDTELDVAQTHQFSEAVLHSADWTVETIVAQLIRGNIEMNPRFQRRDAWNIRRKSAFIESLILGLPVPQIVLAEKRGQRGKYIVLDGKQRLLSLLQYTGNAETSDNNAFKLVGLEARTDLARKTFKALNDPALENDLNAFMNYTVRTVVIRNWPSFDFLHLVFLRLNTGSVKLSPQELRQAMFPGEFSNRVDDAAAESTALRELLSRDSPDPRMRDVELLVRFLGFHFFLSRYTGRMKDFLDYTCEELNNAWPNRQLEIEAAIVKFNVATEQLIQIFGAEKVARKTNSRSFNRAIFDALVFYAADERILEAIQANPEATKAAMTTVLQDSAFLEASESSTAGVPNTLTRLRVWGINLRQSLNINFVVPELRQAIPGDEQSRTGIAFGGFWT
ncbi:uncharacterized protein DUF262 [Methylobacter tundripaludum]|uniref:Uncharacterized protein DUF262 n=1 Tax=Methylobacter tundripaludum TaxID=173365 RepID=A0A2S6HCN4_9GAMM|nr:DUF262 domain-containing protein [Methylobacter tundripaludum]PPK75254.1 uncharacterized protein DUF262 [Methylobacter tundripaludum]